MLAERILVLAPHPDDEVVGAAAAIGRALAAGAEVSVLYLTTGVPAPEVLWPWQRAGHAAWVARRREEARAVAAELGVTPVVFHDWPTRTLKSHLAAALPAVVAAVRDTAAAVLWVPAYEGGHQDHDVCAWLAAQAAIAPRAAGHEIPVWEFAEYTYTGGRVRSQWFPGLCGVDGEDKADGRDVAYLELTDEEQATKRHLLSLYRSERRNLGHIKVARESFRLQAPYDWSKPPHAGVLFYQRFQWVPFRHPRIDPTKPEDVCAALAAQKKPK